MKTYTFYLFALLISISSVAQCNDYLISRNIFYQDTSLVPIDDYMKERCVLDLYYPTNVPTYKTVVWIHGGGLTGGSKHFPEGLLNQGVAIVSINYRLYPKVKAPTYIEDAAAAVSWVFKNIASYGGDTTQIYISGHSAGGYLASMITLDKSYLQQHEIDANLIAGAIPLSGHTITHFTVRKERGIPGTQAIVDHLAPLYHVRNDAPPMLLITGDRELEMLGRYEENAYMMRMMKVCGHQQTELFELDGYGHNITAPSCQLIINEINKH